MVQGMVLVHCFSTQSVLAVLLLCGEINKEKKPNRMDDWILAADDQSSVLGQTLTQKG